MGPLNLLVILLSLIPSISPYAVHRQAHRPLKATAKVGPTSTSLLVRVDSDDEAEKICPCPGCTYQKNPLGAPTLLKAERFFHQSKQLWHNKIEQPCYPLNLPTPSPGWRTLAKLAASPQSKFSAGCLFGLYTPGSHTVLPVNDCPAHHPLINDFLVKLERATKKAGVTATVENPKGGREGMLRYVLLSVSGSSRLSCTLVWNTSQMKQCQPHLSRLLKLIKADCASVRVNLNDRPGNAITSDRWHTVHGPQSDFEALGAGPGSQQLGRIHFEPGSFKQANYQGFGDIVERVRKVVVEKRPAQVTEMYAGAGCIGFNLLSCPSLERIVMSDVVASNLKSYRQTLKTLPPALAGKAEYVVGRAESVLESCQGSELVVVDPPRKGLDKGLVSELKSRSSPYFADLKTLCYVSCGFDSLARDVEELVKGGWRVEEAEGWCLFVGADHVESLVILVR